MNESWPIERAGELLDAWVRWTQTSDAPSVARIVNFPPLTEFPEHVRGKSFAVVESGSTSEVTELVLAQPFPVVHDGAPLRALDADTVAALVELCGAHARSPLLALEIRHDRDDEYELSTTALATTGESVDGFHIYMRQLKEKLEPWTRMPSSSESSAA